MKKEKDYFGYLTIAIIFGSFWFLIAPYFNTYNIITGTLSIVGLIFIWHDLLFRPERKTSFKAWQFFGLLKYFLHLLLNIVKANMNVAKIVLSKKMEISPGFIILRMSLEKDLSRVLYANSITLTPGTVTIDLTDDRLLVHALTEEAARGVSDWYLEDMMKELEGEKGYDSSHRMEL